MHEIFLTAQVTSEEFPKALRILQGYCGMQPVTILQRRLTWEGPKTRTPKGLDKKFLEAISPPKRAPWVTLSEQLSRQSYMITLLYEVDQEHFGRPKSEGEAEAARSDPDQMLGTLRWNDLPEPGAGRPVSSRLTVNIDNEANLCKILASQSHRFTGEMIQESRRFIHNNVTFELSRYMQLSQERAEKPPSIQRHLPTFDSLAPFDSESKWILTASATVLNGADPVQMKRGVDELTAIKSDFEGCIDLMAMDRHIFDTRVKLS